MRIPIRTGAVAVTALALLGTTAAAAPGASGTVTSSSSTASTAAWCAAVIRINTRFGTMKNKRYLPQSEVSDKARIAVVEYALAHRGQLLALTPSQIKKAQRDELAFYARWKANHYARTTGLAPMTIAEYKQLAEFQRTKCGITGI